jgi:hypothetical protein
MALSISITGTTMRITGNTYDHKEYFKSLGGKWESKTKAWIITNTEDRERELHEYIKKHKKVRRCGFCGEPGHNRTKCSGYAAKLRQDKIEAARKFGSNFEMLKSTPYCECHYEEVCDEKKNIWRIPVLCRNCHLWCCAQATPNPKCPNNPFDFVCPHHGSSMENMLNDTRGT